MQEHAKNENYVEKGESFLMRRALGLALGVVPVALVAVTVAHAAPATFGPAGGFVVSIGQNCASGGATGTVGSLSINNGQGISLFGTANLPIPANFAGTNCAVLHWTGNGSGTFSTPTLPARWDWVTTLPAGVVMQAWHLTFIINGHPVILTGNSPSREAARAAKAASPLLGLPGIRTLFDCFANCGTSIVDNNQVIIVPNGVDFNDYEVILEIDVTSNSSASARAVSVSVPQAGSIDINPGGAAPPGQPGTLVTGAPAVSPLVLLLTALGMAGFGTLLARRAKTSSSGGS